MNKRIDKKKQKRTMEAATAASTPNTVVEIKEVQVPVEVKVPVEVPVPAKTPAFFVQYQNAEYTVNDITDRVVADCNAKGHAVENPESLSIYLKPEDGKAYYTLGEFNGYIEL